MQKDFLQDTDSRQSEGHEISQSELAARAWTNRLGDSPIEFYQMVSVEGQAAIRKGLQDELTRLHAEQQKMMAERESVQEQEKARAERESARRQDNTATESTRGLKQAKEETAQTKRAEQTEQTAQTKQTAQTMQAEQTRRAEQWREAKLDRQLTDSEKQYAKELAKQAWKNVTAMDSPLPHELTPRAEALKVQEFYEEVGRIRAEDEHAFTADQRKEILENPSERMRESYRDSIHERACGVFEGRWHSYEDFKPEYRDRLLTRWQEEMINLRDKDRSAEQTKDLGEGEIVKTESLMAESVREAVVKESSDFTYEHFVEASAGLSDRASGDSQASAVRTDAEEIELDETSQKYRDGGGNFAAPVTIAHELIFGDEANITVSAHEYERSKFEKDLERVVSESERIGAAGRVDSDVKRENADADVEREITGAEGAVHAAMVAEALVGSGAKSNSDLLNELKGVKEIQESVSKWWTRESSKTPFGPEMQVIDYPRAPGSEWNFEDYDREFDLYFEFEHEPDATASVWESGIGANSVEQDINRLLFDDGQSFDQINRPYGLESHDDRENSKEDNLEFERSDWNERGR